MIDSPHPRDWRDLQAKVARLFQDIGFQSEVEKKISTPRGEVVVDVHAVDTSGPLPVHHIAECKCWSSNVPQSIAHSFTTVMHETGANVGYLISAKGFQSGVIGYLRNTNIHPLTYLEFQQELLSPWLKRYLAPRILAAADVGASHEASEALAAFGRTATAAERLLANERLALKPALIAMIQYRLAEPSAQVPDIDAFKKQVAAQLGPCYLLTSEYLRDLVDELIAILMWPLATRS